jgi:hypothetical protein
MHIHASVHALFASAVAWFVLYITRTPIMIMLDQGGAMAWPMKLIDHMRAPIAKKNICVHIHVYIYICALQYTYACSSLISIMIIYMHMHVSFFFFFLVFSLYFERYTG